MHHQVIFFWVWITQVWWMIFEFWTLPFQSNHVCLYHFCYQPMAWYLECKGATWCENVDFPVARLGVLGQGGKLFQSGSANKFIWLTSCLAGQYPVDVMHSRQEVDFFVFNSNPFICCFQKSCCGYSTYHRTEICIKHIWQAKQKGSVRMVWKIVWVDTSWTTCIDGY